jgi:hypothetical protein
MADGTETDKKETKNVESAASVAHEAESNAADKFRQDIQDNLGGPSNKGSLQSELMDKLPAGGNRGLQQMDKLPVEGGNKKEAMQKLPADGSKKENMDKLPAEAGNKEHMDKLPAQAGKKEHMDKLPAEAGNKEHMDKLPAEKEGFDKDKDGKLDDYEKKIAEELPEREELPTGDVIKRDENGETLITPNGDEISVNDDGSHSIKGDVKSVETKDGVTTVKLGDGSEVSFDEQGILSVQRGNQGVMFGRQVQDYGWGSSGGDKLGGSGGGSGGIDRKPRIEDFLPKIKLK